MPRSSHTQALLGSEVYLRVKETPVLVVGAGGIGCELLKNLVMVGFGNIEIIDLDTIDLSNLNRQFLFRRPDVGRPKALVAAATARHFNPSSGINIHARHGNVKETQNDFEWIKGFGLVMNALDNMDARRHVNRLCQAAQVPLIESGTAGYLGQVTPIINGRTECFDCVPKQTPKSFPVCTIRATPSEPIHCIVWAKSYLFGKLFGEDDEALDEEELDRAKASGENAEEIENLKKEAAAFREVRQALGEEDGPRRVFEKVFTDDINRLLSMDDMWNKEGRVKPKALEYAAIMDGTFEAPPLRTTASAPATNGRPSANGNGNGSSSSANGHAGQTNGMANARQLKDQKELSLKENLELFVDSCRRMSARAISHPDVLLSFDKDDDDTLDFVLATANLRATAYGIANKTRFQVKEMAGNIIPAIATTNAIIAGMIVMQAVQMLGLTSPDHLRNTFTRQMPAKPLGMSLPAEPSKDCAVCSETYVPLRVDVTRCTLGEFVLDIVGKWLGGGQEEDEDLEWEVYEGTRLLADPEEVDNHDKSLGDMGIERGKILTIFDVEEKYRPVHFCIYTGDPNGTLPYTLPETIPTLTIRPPKPAAPAPIEFVEEEVEVKVAEGVAPAANGKPVGVKRPAPDDEDEEGGEAKKRKVLTVAEDDDDDDFEIL